MATEIKNACFIKGFKIKCTKEEKVCWQKALYEYL